MADKVVLVSTARTEFGKGPARRDRAAGLIPAVIYGHGAEPLHVNLPGHEAMIALRVQNALITIDLEGEEHLALAKDVQRDPVRQIIEHVDLLTVRRGEKVQVDVSIVLEGEVDPSAAMNLDSPTVTIEAEATHLPEGITVDIEGRQIGEHVYASDLVLPRGVELLTDPETLIVNISAPVEQDLGEEPEAEEGAEGAEEGAEGEESSEESSDEN